MSTQLRKELFPRWSEAEAAWAIVTGKVRRTPQPIVSKLTNDTDKHLTYGTIDLTVEPWVATEAVVKAYQWAQARMLGRKPRALAERNLRVVQFVMGDLGELISHEMKDEAVPPHLSWRKLMDRWNEANPEDAYTDERHFHRDFYRTANAAVRPYDASHLMSSNRSIPRLSAGDVIHNG